MVGEDGGGLEVSKVVTMYGGATTDTMDALEGLARWRWWKSHHDGCARVEKM